MKTILLCLFGFVLFGCTQRPSQETSSPQDTTSAKLTVDTVRTESKAEVKAPEVPLVISDSSASALNDLVIAQFEKVYADSANYYRVTLTDYYDEYEGQDVMKITRWYYDKDFSIVYSWYSIQNGAMDKPNIDEYLLKNNAIVCAKGDYDAYSGDRKYLRWDVQAGGVAMKWSPYSGKIESAEALGADYIKESQKAWDSNLATLPYELDKEILSDDDRMITILTETPKPSELMDYTKVTISKALYDRLVGEH